MTDLPASDPGAGAGGAGRPWGNRIAPGLAVLALAVAAGLFARAYVQGEDPGYIWDARCFWELYVTSGEVLRQGLPGWLAGVIADVRGSDYNGLAVDLLVPVQALAGPARPAFVTALVAVYLVPSALVFGQVCRDLAGRGEGPGRRAWGWGLSGLALVSVPLWAPTLSGMPDIVGCVPLLLLVRRLIVTDLNQPQTRESLVQLGLLVWLPFLCRRWYAYTVVSCLITAAVWALIDHVRVWRSLADRDGAGASVWPLRLMGHLGVIGGVAAALVLGVQGGLALRILTTSYRAAYSAYQLTDPWEHLVRVWAHFGPVPLLLAALGCVAGLIDPVTRRATLFVSLAFALGAGMFASVQLFAAHHYLPLAMGLLLLTGIGLSVVWGWLARFGAGRVGLAIALAGLGVAGFVHGLVTPIRPLAPLFAAETAYPLRLETPAEYRRLSRDLLTLTGPRGTASVFASSPVLCDSLLESVSGEALDSHLHMASQVDSRDLFDTDSLMTDFAVVADPVQTHLRPGDQQGIVRPAEALSTGTGIGRAYQPLPQVYHLTRTVTARIYRKVRPFYAAEVEALFAGLFQAHPAWRAVYGPERRGRIIAR